MTEKMEIYKNKGRRFCEHYFKKSNIGRFCMYLLLLDLAYVFLYPFLYMLITSVKSPQDIIDVTVNWLINSVHTENYELSWDVLHYPTKLVWTSFVVGIATFGHLLSCSFVGYGFARFHFKGKGFLFFLLFLAIIVPPQTIITPEYMIYTALGWQKTVLPIIAPTWLGLGLKGGLFIFIFRQFYLSLPSSLEEAASIDGCGPINTFFKIALPSSRSSIMVCLVLSIVWHWNDYFQPSIYLSSDSQTLLPQALPGLYDIINGSAGTEMGVVGDLANIYTVGVAMAATTLVILPVLLVYAFLQKQFIEGVERSGITGE